jgi:hypothetical protein
MGILVLITMTILESLWIIVCHRWNSILEFFFSSFVYLYIVVCFALASLSVWAIINYIITNGLCAYRFEDLVYRVKV